MFAQLARAISNQFKVPKTVFYREREGECSICAEEDCKLVNLSKNCKHLPTTCATCLKHSITTDIKSKGNYKFQCSDSQCEVWFEPLEYYHLLDQPLIDLVDKLLLHRMLEKSEEFRWCKSRKGCGAGQLVSNHKELRGYYACYACEEPLCYRHSIEWHKGFTCDEFDAERAKNPGLASDAAVLQFCKQCPNEKCKTPIMKLEGCDVITCCQFGTHTCTPRSIIPIAGTGRILAGTDRNRPDPVCSYMFLATGFRPVFRRTNSAEFPVGSDWNSPEQTGIRPSKNWPESGCKEHEGTQRIRPVPTV